MSIDSDNRFFYLNRDNVWADFESRGLERDADGGLHLYRLPLLEGEPSATSLLTTPTLPAGLTFDERGNIYYTVDQVIMKIDSCADTPDPLPCIGGEGDRAGRFNQPSTVIYHPMRQALFVADSRNHRIQIFDVETGQLIGMLGQSDPISAGKAGAEPGHFDTPIALALDSEGSIYVADKRRVQKFSWRGKLISRFSRSRFEKPTAIAVDGLGEATRIYVLDGKVVRVFNRDGGVERSIGRGLLQQPMGLAVRQGAVYVGDNSKRCILKFTTEGELIGVAEGYVGTVAALTLSDSLWVHTGEKVLRLALEGAYARRGALWGGPFGKLDSDDEPVRWNRLKAIASLPDTNAHLQFYVYVSDHPKADDDPKAAPPPPDENGFDSSVWCALEEDMFDGLLQAFHDGDGIPYMPTARCIWLGALFSGEGRSSAHLHQLRIDYDHAGYIEHLPAIYGNTPERPMLERFLALFESGFTDLEDQIAQLDRHFDPDGAPADGLAWLASWLDLELDERWSEARKRQAIREAFSVYQKRGTVEGLRQMLRFRAGVDAHIDVPIQQAAVWALPADNRSAGATSLRLGVNTMLASAEPQGAVVGTTAVLDHSHLIRQDDYAMPLFDELAHRFTVQVYRGQVGNDDLGRLQTLIEREKPAHTAFELCIIEPTMRLGFQARIGIDTVLAGAIPPEQASVGTIGKHRQVGIRTRLGK